MRLLIVSVGILLGAAPARASFRPRTRAFAQTRRATRTTRAAHVAAAPASSAGSSSGPSFAMSPPAGWTTSRFSRASTGASFAEDPSAVRLGYFGFSGFATQSRATAVSQTNASAAGSPIAIDEARMTPIPGYPSGAAAASSSAADGGPIPTIRGMADAMTAALDKMLHSMFRTGK